MKKEAILLVEDDREIETYFPHELAAMYMKHEIIAVYLPPYLRKQAL
jgi:hypothetical protein